VDDARPVTPAQRRALLEASTYGVLRNVKRRTRDTLVARGWAELDGVGPAAVYRLTDAGARVRAYLLRNDL
jgi:hypothetical protein